MLILVLLALAWAAGPDLEGALAELAPAPQQAPASPGGPGARVVVLPWPGGHVRAGHPVLVAAVRERLGRADAVLVDALDLHQAGRVRGDLPPEGQLARVSDAEIAAIRAQLRALRTEAARVPDDLAVIGALASLQDRVWSNDRPATRLLLFEIAVAAGEAAHGMRQQVPPFYGQVGAGVENVALYRAAAMLWEERELGVDVVTSHRPGGEPGRALDAIVRAIDAGTHAPLPLALQVDGRFDPEAFAREHPAVVVNGLPREVDASGRLLVPRGRVDVLLARPAGAQGLSERVEVWRLDDRVWFLREAAREAVGEALAAPLLAVPGDRCPDVPAAQAAALGVLAALHPGDDLFVAIPERDRPDRPRLWAWHRAEGRLHAVLDVDRGFPVRFAALVQVGARFGAGLAPPSGAASVEDLVAVTPESVPVGLALRGHLGRLVLAASVAVGPAIAPAAEGRWTERHPSGGEILRDPSGAEALRHAAVQVRGEGQVGVVLQRLAPLGLGPRLALGVAGADLPRAVDLLAHVGGTADPSFGRRPPLRRIVAILDLDLYAGVRIPYGDTLLRGADGRPLVLPVLGMSVGVGSTF
ncbi:MAG: hypothetical protein H6732_03025 [Alphaproteobacteria bacterium]|nr:hypothetical protein [Alphaproteobacteria bacterium]